MKKGLIKYAVKYSSMLSTLALMIGISAAGSACWIWQYQPEEPERMRQFKKN